MHVSVCRCICVYVLVIPNVQGHGTSLSFISQERLKERQAEGPLTEAIINNMKLAGVEEEMGTHNLTVALPLIPSPFLTYRLTTSQAQSMQ